MISLDNIMTRMEILERIKRDYSLVKVIFFIIPFLITCGLILLADVILKLSTLAIDKLYIIHWYINDLMKNKL